MPQESLEFAPVCRSWMPWMRCRPAAHSAALALVVVWMLAIGATAAAATSQIVEIAPSATFPAPVPVALADNGVVVGNDTNNGMTAARPFTWTAAGGFVALQAQRTIPPFEVFYNSIAGVSPTGEVVGTENITPQNINVAITWPAGAPAGAAPTVLPCYIGSGGSPCGSFDNEFGQTANASGTVVGTGLDRNIPACPTSTYPNGCNLPTTWPGGGTATEVGNASGAGLGINASGAVLWAGADGFHVTSGSNDAVITCLNTAYPAALNAPGTVVGIATGPSPPPAYWSAGKCTSLPLLPSTPSSAGGAAEAISDRGVIVGRSGASGSGTAVEWVAGKVVDLNTLLPSNSGWVLKDAFAINASGQILGSGTLNGHSAYFVVSAPSNDLSASVVLTGSDGKPLSNGSGSVGQTVVATVTLSAAAGAAGPITGITVDPGGLTVSPSSALKLVSGPSPAPPTTLSPGQSKQYVLSYKVVGAGQTTVSVTANGNEGGAAQHATASAVAQFRQSLSVTVTLARKSLRLALDKHEMLVPKTVGMTVKIKNPGTTTVQAVAAQKPLFSVVGGAKAAKIPLKVLSGPKPSARRDLKPGATIEVTYELEVSGDGTYDVQVLAIGSAPGVAHVAGVGTDRLTVGAPVLVMSSAMGRMVRSPDARSLVRAGTVFTVKLELRNISYTHTLGIYPMRPEMQGNASDGHVETAGLPIQNPSLTSPPQSSEAFELAPRTTREVEIIVRTTATYADVQSPEFPGGGTRAVVQIPTPEVADVGLDEAVLGQFPARDVLVTGPKEYQVGIDDRDFRTPPPESNWAARAAYFSVGVFEGVWNLTGGVVVAVFHDLPLWLAKGIIAVPSAIVAYAQLEAELWDSIKGDPAQVALFLNVVTNTSLLAYKHAPALAGNIAEYKKKIDAMVLAHYTRLANDESTGNIYAAIQEYGKEATEITGNLVLASGVLTRLPAAVEALNSIKQASYVKVGETLNAIADGVGGREALLALKQAVPGYEFLTTDLRKFYGLSDAQVAYLRGFAKQNKLIITLRSRAEESLKWLNEGAVLKPEQIKIKTVSIDDINYLGYRPGDLGRVVIRRPPSQAELARSLRADGFGPQDPEWATAFKRLKDRTTEFNHPAYDQGYVKYLEDGSSNGELTLRWNLQQNSVDSSVLPNGYTKYGMRLLDEGGGNRVLQFCVDTPPCRAASPGWRSVTGDVDFLSIVHADGSPLSVLERIAVYRQMAKSPVGMLHPAADTWTLVKRGGQEVFDFKVKTNEFVRGGTVAQFAPDGVVRAVVFNPASRFTSATNYRIFWNGGYTNVKRLLFR